MSRRDVLGWAALVLGAAIVGVLAVKPVMTRMLDRTAIRNGPWRTSITTGRSEANLYERAAVAIAGLYALAPAETVYYTAFADSDGQPLDGRCDYRVTGRALPSRWWSLTMYGADSYLVANAAGIYSRHASNLALDADGGYAVAVSAHAKQGNWLPAPAQGAFSITLRLYNPAPAVYDNLTTIARPAIARESCP
jgi:hypothetical protein